MKKIVLLYKYLLTYLRQRLNRLQYMMFVAVITGLIAGLSAVLLKTFVHFLQEWINRPVKNDWIYLFFPTLGLLIVVFLTNRFFHGYIEKGVAMVLRSIAGKSAFIPLSDSYKHIITSAFTVGLGGSAGLEAPIVATGSAIGSNTGRIHGMEYRERSLLLACGAAAGIAAVFNAPIAGVIFAIEILLTETIVSYFIPLMIAAVTGALCSRIILQESILFNFRLREAFDYNNVPFYILLGFAAGFISLYYARVFKGTEKKMHALHPRPYHRAILAGLFLVVLMAVFPPLFGEGYNTISLLASGNPQGVVEKFIGRDYLNDWGFLFFAGAILLLKPVATGITLGGGGNGGNFAPSLFVGAYLGFFISRLANNTKWLQLPEANFSLVGMAGVLSGVMYCPLTAIFLIAEITNGYELFIPLMLVSAISFFIVKHYEPYSMETKQLAMEGRIFTHRKEDNILSQLKVADFRLELYDTIQIDQSLADLVGLINTSNRNLFAVTDKDNRFTGIVELNDLKGRLFDPVGLSETKIKTYVKKAPALITPDDSMKKVMEKMDITQSWYLPVLNTEKEFLGFLSKTSIFEKYREALANQADLYT
ncbi:chloride channel protein [Flavihumibacter sp. UBA7668]|uniref:chloride channel protein n=1 Tax=Flavihumibacter sp. UBA7668 TaxID=1946542 RepID=UPI0025BF60F5|nr:chloride channel protein [Flavihumibacter sp. UBA7668]